MEPEILTVLKKLQQTANDNNTILKKIRNNQVWSRNLKIIYWIIIIGSIFGIYSFLKPYVAGTLSNYATIESNIGSIKEFLAPSK